MKILQKKVVIPAAIALIASGVAITKTNLFKEQQNNNKIEYLINRIQRDERLRNGSASNEDKILHYGDMTYDGMKKAEETLKEAKDDLLNDPRYWASIAGLGVLAAGAGVVERKDEENS